MPFSRPRDQDEINRWSVSAPYWEKHREIIRQMFAPVSQALAKDAQISSRQTVLDIATGPGEPALSIAALVGPEGKVFGIDLIPDMVAAARREASRLRLENVTFEVASADQLPFAPDTFDAVLSRFGVMFFPSPLDAVREMLRVLKPERKLALAVWHFADRNPFHCSLSRVIDRFVDPPPVAPNAPDAFRFATPGKLVELCRQAGVVAPVERLLQFRIDAPVPVEAFWQLRLEMSERLREKIARMTKDQMAEVHRLAVESLSEYSTELGLSFPAEVLIVSGAKGRSIRKTRSTVT
jgi:SAM-dependent methyltransferase